MAARAWHRALWLVASLAVTATAVARPFPIHDPLAATVVGTPFERTATLATDVPIEFRSLAPLVKRRTPPTLAYARPLVYLLAPQPKPAPLVFVIAGTGADAHSSKCRLLARVFYGVGYSVACLPSPTSVGAVLGAARHPVPGYMPADVAELIRLMHAARKDADDALKIKGVALCGWSLGATEAAFVARRDARRHDFGFSRVLLLNPAVSLWTSISNMDRLLRTHVPGGVDGIPAFISRGLGDLKKVYGKGEPLNFDRETLYSAFREGHASHDQFGGAIGLVFRLSLANMAYAADVITNAGQIVPADTRVGAYAPRGRYMRAAFSMSFQDYVRRLLLPYWNRRDRSLTLAKLKSKNDLRSIRGFLRRDRHVFVFANADDPILGDGDIAFLRRVFGKRAHVSRYGGHMGNLASKTIVHAIQKRMAP